MSTMQSTVERVAAEEAIARAEATPKHNDGWKPAGPALTDDLTVDQLVNMPESDFRALINDGPIPSIGHLVVYHLRDGDSKNMRTKFPAIVLDANPKTGLLSLIIIVDAGDEWRQDRVPPHQAPEPGWELVKAGTIADINFLIERTFGAHEAPETSIMSMLADLQGRIEALEAKRGPGRPSSSDKSKD